MTDYSWVTHKMFDKKLEEIIEERFDIISIPGVYEVLSEHFSDQVLEELEEDREDDITIQPPEPTDDPPAVVGVFLQS